MIRVGPIDRNARIIGELGPRSSQVELLAVRAGPVQHGDGVLLLMVTVFGAAVGAAHEEQIAVNVRRLLSILKQRRFNI